MLSKCHYRQAKIDGAVFNLYEDAYVKLEDGKPDYIAQIVEMFESVDNESYFMARWFYRAENTVIKGHSDLVDKKHVFLSDIKDENLLDCIVSKLKIVKLTPNVGLTTEKRKNPPCDYYYDMKYTLPYLTFSNLVDETDKSESDASSTVSSECGSSGCSNDANLTNGNTIEKNSSNSSELDLYSGCGAMSTRLCLGATLAGVKLVTRWAVDINSYACKSVKLNLPETQVRNEPVENFLELIKAWAKLCEEFDLLGSERSESGSDMEEDEMDEENGDVKKEESEEDHSNFED